MSPESPPRVAGWCCEILPAEGQRVVGPRGRKARGPAESIALDLYTHDQKHEVERLITIGATRTRGDIARVTISSC